MLRSLLRQGLVAEYNAATDHPGISWRHGDGTMMAMQITEAGRQAIGYDEARNAADDAEFGGPTQAEYETEPDDGHDPKAAAGILPANGPTEPHSESLAPPVTMYVGDCDVGDKGAGGPSRTPFGAPRSGHLRKAAQAVLAVWGTPEQPGLAHAIDALQAALVPKRLVPKDATARVPRQETKQAAVLALLRRPEGASGPQLIEATGWAPHTVRGFLAGLSQKGIAVTVLQRVRQVGPTRSGPRAFTPSTALPRRAEVRDLLRNARPGLSYAV